MKFFTIPKERTREFAHEAKSRGLLYVMIRDKKHPDLSEIMVYAEDAAKVNRVLDNMQLDYVKAESANVVFEDTPDRQERGQDQSMPDRQGKTEQPDGERKSSSSKEEQPPVKMQTVEMPEGTVEFEVGENENIFDIGEIGTGNFTQAQGEWNPSGTSSRSRSFSSGDRSERGEKRPSVRQELREIRQDQKKLKKTAQRQRNRYNTQVKKKRRPKGKGR